MWLTSPSTRMRALVAEGIAEKDWIQAIVTNTFETVVAPKAGEAALEELDIVKALCQKFPEMAVGKILVDKMVELAGETGPHLRKCVTETNVSHEQ